MAYSLEVTPRVFAKLRKLLKKDKVQLEAIKKKALEICEDPYRFKPLRGTMKGSRRVHIQSCFVLIYEIEEDMKIVRLLFYGHHDEAYQAREGQAG